MLAGGSPPRTGWRGTYTLPVHRLLLIPVVLLAGCAPIPVGFDAPSETKRQDAIVAAAASGDRSPQTLRGLISQLDSPDPATRMLAIRTLERLTGQTFGYDYSDPSWKRERFVQAWVDWYDSEYGTASAPEADHG